MRICAKASRLHVLSQLGPDCSIHTVRPVTQFVTRSHAIDDLSIQPFKKEDTRPEHDVFFETRSISKANSSSIHIGIFFLFEAVSQISSGFKLIIFLTNSL